MNDTRWHVNRDDVPEQVKTFVERAQTELSERDVDGQLSVSDDRTVRAAVYNAGVDETAYIFGQIEDIAKEVYGVESYQMLTSGSEATITRDSA